MSNHPHEPSAANRAAARELRDLYLALRQEGFSEREALAVVGEILRGATGNGT